MTCFEQLNRARYYDPSTGRFLSEDPIHFAGGDANLYRYVKNRSVRFRDPSGLHYSAPDLSAGGGGSGIGAGENAGYAIGVVLGGAALACGVVATPAVAQYCMINPLICNQAALAAIDTYDSSGNIHGGPVTGAPPASALGWATQVIDEVVGGFK